MKGSLNLPTFFGAVAWDIDNWLIDFVETFNDFCIDWSSRFRLCDSCDCSDIAWSVRSCSDIVWFLFWIRVVICSSVKPHARHFRLKCCNFRFAWHFFFLFVICDYDCCSSVSTCVGDSISHQRPWVMCNRSLLRG